MRSFSLSALAWALLSGSAFGQIALDVADESTGTTDNNTIAFTSAAGADCGVVIIIQNDNQDIVTGVTWGTGNSMTRQLHVGHSADEDGGVYIYFLDNIATGAQTITATKSMAIGSIMAAYSLTSTTDACAVENSNSASGTSTNPSVSVSTGSGVNTWGAAGLYSGRNGTGDVTAGSLWTLHISNDAGAETRFTEYLTQNDSGDGFAADFTIAFSDDYAIGAIAIAESGGATSTAGQTFLTTLGVPPE